MSSEIPEIFKALLEDPFTVPILDYNDNDKDKLFTGDNVDLERGSGMGPSAALTPAIWDKTIPYDGETFHLEYMDLEEFLMENGIPTSSSSLDDALNMEIAEKKTEKPTSTTTAPISLLPVLELDQCEEEVVTITLNSADITANTEVVTDKDRLTPETIDPEEIEVNVNFDPDPTDLVLSSVPGGELFNPRKHKFSEEELKPQPMIKKAKKVYVPEDSKDEKYWQRGGRRTTWRLSVPGTRGDSRRTKSRCGQRSWSVRTRRYDRKWASYGRTLPAARMLWPATQPNSESLRCWKTSRLLIYLWRGRNK
ncbi:hypothetical protein J4Q44_G00278100 [Coregonus suidteri]|uniref:Thyrotroph embryonic factor n=1 Tax=Coregonus suidteri TaxID=861788 RepID=A0AAN8KZD3_9TELE